MSTYTTTLSDSDISLHLSEGSALSSDSDHYLETPTKSINKKSRMADKKKKKPTKPKKVSSSTTTAIAAQPKKGSKQVKDEELYCICRQGYDGKQFMIACDTCHEWFHGQCIGINPKSVTKHYYCDACQSKTTKKKSTNQDPPPKITTNRKGRGKKKATTTSSRKKSNQDANTSISISIPLTPAPPTAQPIPTHATILTMTSTDKDDEDEDLDDICPICEFECTCGTSTTSAPAPVPVSILHTPSVPSLDTTSLASPSMTKKGTIKKQPKTQPAKSKKSKTAKKMTYYTPQSDEEDVDILDDIDDDHHFNNITVPVGAITMYDDNDDDNDDSDNLVMDPFSADEELSSADDSDAQLDNLSLDHDSQLGSYSSSIHIDSGDDDEEDIEQEEERAIIAEMMENGLSDNNSSIHQEHLNDSDDDETNGEYYIEDDYSMDLDDNELDDGSSDSDDFDDDHGDMDDEEAHSYYLRTNGLWASSEEEEEEEEDDDDDENMAFHSDPGPLHEASDEDDTTTDLAALIGGDNNLFTNIAEAFMHVLAPLANIHNSHSDSISPTSLVPPVSALPLNVATFDLGSNAADYLNSAPTSPVSHRMDDFLRRPSLPSSAVLAANGHHDTDLASDALIMLSSVLSSEALGLPVHHHTPTATATATATINTNKASNPVKDQDSVSLPATHHHHHHELIATTNSAPSLSSTTSSLSTASSPPQSSYTPTVTSPSATHDTTTAITPVNYTDPSSPSPPSPSPLQQASAVDIHSPIASTSSATQPDSPQPSYDLASLLPPDMKIPDQLMELIKSSLAASINEKGLFPSSSSLSTTSASSSAEQSTTNKKIPPELSTLSRQLLPKPTDATIGATPSLDGEESSHGPSSESDKKRPLSIVTEFGKKRQRGDNDTAEDKQMGIYDDANDADDDDDDNGVDDMMVSMDELLDTSQLDAARPDDDDNDHGISDDRFARDLSRWERVPIGAFRLMRSKNRLWLNR